MSALESDNQIINIRHTIMNANVSNAISRFTKNKAVLILVIALVILFLANPTKKDFDQYIPAQKIALEDKRMHCDNMTTAREYNFIIFSVFYAEIKCVNNDSFYGEGYISKSKYLGIFKNFIKYNSQTLKFKNELIEIPQ